MEIELNTLQLENSRLKDYLLRTNPLINSILLLQDKMSKERFFEKHIEATEWQGLEQTVNTCYSDFSIRLKSSFPRLTKLDIRYCCLIKLHIPVVDIATLMHVKTTTVFMVKYRIYKLKIGMIENLSLDSFLDVF